MEVDDGHVKDVHVMPVSMDGFVDVDVSDGADSSFCFRFCPHSFIELRIASASG